MKGAKRYVGIVLIVLFLFNVIIPPVAFSEDAVVVMTISEGKRYYAVVAMTPTQLSALTEQPGITISKTPKLTDEQIAVPLPSELGEGFIVAKPAVLAAGMNAVGITTVATKASILNAVAAAGTITKGATIAGEIVAAGVAKGTVVIWVVTAAGIIGGIIAAIAGGSETTTTHH